MELVTKSPGLQHIAEDIFNILDKKSLLDCRLVNKSWMAIMKKQTFWLKRGLKKSISENNLENCSRQFQILEETYENFTNLLIKMFKKTQINVSYGNCC